MSVIALTRKLSMVIRLQTKEVLGTIPAFNKKLKKIYKYIGNFDYRSVLSIAVIISKNIIYFIIGNGDIKNPTKTANLLFGPTIEYKIRKTTFSTKFGILIF